MPESYPLPAHAASFWIAGPDLWIAFPGQGPEGKGHSIRLPASVAGLATAIQILKDRAQAESLKIGNDGTPSQYTAEQYAGRAWGTVNKRLREEREAKKLKTVEEEAAYRARKEKHRAEERARAKAELEELGL